jgi:dipeptidyl aminopeptidase/acylaminoacyl peptidase
MTDSTEIAKRLIDQRSSVGQPAVSPDGERIAYVVATTDLENNTNKSRIWLDDGPVTAGDHDSNPTWSPDGRHLAFTSRRGEKKGDSTLHILPVDGPGECRTVCSMVDGLGDVAWSPNGKWIGFTSRTQDKRYGEKDASWQAPRKIERFFSRLNGEDWVFDRPQHIYVVAADGTGVPKNLTPGEFQHGGVAWVNDSSGVLTTATRHDSWDRDLSGDVYFVPVTAGENGDTGDEAIRCLTAHDGEFSQPSISPDGTKVAIIGHGELETYPQNAGVGILPFDSEGITFEAMSWPSNELDRTFITTFGARPPVWENNDSVLATAEDRGDTHLYRITVDGSTAPASLTTAPVTVQTFDAVAGTVATIQTSVTSPPELFVNHERRTHVTAAFSKGLLEWETFEAPTADGEHQIDCWIMRPADFDENKTYPVLLNVHGGPFTQYGEYFFDEAQMQAMAGFVVVMGNPRGGSGRDTYWGQSILGTKHQKRPGSGWGGLDVDDVLSILDAALADYSFCDPDRVGMLGGSYGGFMATWLAGHHGDRFRAFCSERAVNNVLSEEWNSDIATAFRTEHGPNHIEDPEVYRAVSPIESVHNIDKPMLLIHSEEDFRCPIVQAEELWIALRLLGKEADFYRFPGENHELSRGGSPVHRVQRGEIILDWFAEKLV